ncbi:hypothetical protein IWQ60_003468 [Tieghemiomyces parasiticus]|uniref:Arb2 domain-containing protein n=1 Tax=Tieghemiomyces parasiticus TaxID=78921 RepID=A0A9W8A9K6_9FUNG|nr:hypothetical protein IWQ60_003468 [Tieghemiomyces parasiticus]
MLVRKRVQTSEASNGTSTTPTSIWFSTLAEFNLHLTDGDLRVVDEAGNPYDTKTTPSKLGFKAEQANAVYAVLADLLKGELQKDGLEATRLPLGATQDEPHCLILHSPQAFTTTGRVLIFALGSGDFLGCWNRSSLLQKGLKAGSVLPYVQQARDEGYEVIILNLDENYLWNRRTMETHCRNWVENSELGDGVLLPDVSDNQAANVRLADHTLRSALQTREQAAVFDFLRGTAQA